MRISRVLVGMTIGLSVALVGAPTAQAATAPVPPPPSMAEQIQTTNAMLQPADLVGPLASSNPSWSTGYNSPQGGEDPMWLCRYGEDKYVFLPGDHALGYSSATGRVTQNVFVYRTAAKARAAVLKARAGLKAHCNGTWTMDTWRTRLVAGTIDSPGGGMDGLWVRSDAIAGTKKGNTSMYVYLVPLGNRVSVTWLDSPASRTTAEEQAALDELSVDLADRLNDQATLAITQDATLTKGQTVMLQPADVPASLPYQRPAKGGWSTFSGFSPGFEDISADGSIIAAGTAGMITALGANEGAQPASLYQRVTVYSDASAATDAWNAFRGSVLGAKQTPDRPLSTTKQTDRQATGESAATFEGTPGLWVRTLTAMPGNIGDCYNNKGKKVACAPMSSKVYSLYLLVGSTIQETTYAATVSKLANVPLDQAAVDDLAMRLAQRWAAS